jgi:predicted phosphoadenosine phosphosulfate sulfurtransferase
MSIQYLQEDVFQAAQERLAFIFAEFDNIYVSFSGGKDSGVLLNMVIDYMRANQITRKIGVYYMDYEGSYQLTEDFIRRMVEANADLIDLYWVCLTYKTKCGVSIYRNYWLPWNPEERSIWVREYPKLGNGLHVITVDNHEFDFYTHGMEDVDFDTKFNEWIHRRNQAGRTIGLLGIRAQESVNRWRAVASDKKVNMYKGRKWTSLMGKNRYTGYPLYDWQTEDIWTANARQGYDYNRLYDLYYQAGLALDEMRVASAFIDEGVSNLGLHRAIEPNTWAALVGRVNGANFGAIYGATKAMGYQSISLPPGHTWKSYCEFLLSTLPPYIGKMFRKKFESTFNVWLQKGATVLRASLPDLERSGYSFEVLGKPPGKIYEGRDDIVLVKFSEYPDDIDSKHFVNLPSYKRMCITILKNDYSCKYMGYGMTTYEKQLRHDAMQKYKDL